MTPAGGQSMASVGATSMKCSQVRPGRFSSAPLKQKFQLTWPPEADGRQAEPFSSTALQPKFQLTWPLGTKWGGAVPQLTRRVAFGRTARLRGGTPPF